MPNRLINSASPYLLQHADNPVDWQPWDEQALARARAEDKPIFLSIGYAACHWCHVMASESFADTAIATILNERFIPIKVDREERPDLDAIYMQAVVALTGSGGWPLSVFLTPDLRPFYGGTYFPPEPRHGLPSFRKVLMAVDDAWRNRRDEIGRAGQQLTDHLRAALQPAPANAADGETFQAAVEVLLETYDWANGGWGGAPKFPQPMTIEVLLRAAVRGHADALRAARHALDAMARGGMYDVVGGGFHRYAVDHRWHVPHFEKMLYDNAQLAQVYLHAWQLTGEPAYRRVCVETLDFMVREMTGPQGGFFSSLDADSEHEEGKYYVWDEAEIRAALPADDFALFVAAYRVTPQGNWEGRTVLQRALDDATLAARFGLAPDQVQARLIACHAKLLAVRARRVRPATDDKVLTAWNGLALSAFAEAARALNRPDYLNVATRNADFLLTALRPAGRLRRSWRDGRVTGAVFLKDYAALIHGLLDLYQSDFSPRWYTAARGLAEEMIARFSAPDGWFFDTPADGEALLIRPRETQDNATPSGNALAAEALVKLSAFDEIPDWRARAEQMVGGMGQAARRYPTAFARWLWCADLLRGPLRQVAIVGEGEAAQALLSVVRESYRPTMVIACRFNPKGWPAEPRLLHNRPLLDNKPTAYVCEGFVCRQPVTEPTALREQLAATNP